LGLFLWGLFKKTVIADRAAAFVDAAYATPSDESGMALLLASYAFAFQIYCDFSGYTDMAIGIAKMLGFRLSRNFAMPYFATSIQDFWRRWHITLTTWFKNYVYFPLGGSRRGVARHMANVFVVFVISGLWHGANWTFILWGAMHGAMIAVEILAGLLRKASQPAVPTPAWLSGLRALTVFHLVLLSWIIFRSDSLTTAGEIIRRITSALGNWQSLSQEFLAAFFRVVGGESYSVLAAAVAFLFLAEAWLLLFRPRITWARMPLLPRIAALGALALATVFLGRFPENNSFIYFQF
jgi:D-alanyl-lipoteichoic acid acyltransferase DltB (MBOAT superfamily)